MCYFKISAKIYFLIVISVLFKKIITFFCPDLAYLRSKKNYLSDSQNILSDSFFLTTKLF
jgi:hypothetical protein